MSDSSVDLVKRLEARFEPWDRLAATSLALEARGLTEEADALPGPLARGLLELGDDVRQLREVLERSGSRP